MEQRTIFVIDDEMNICNMVKEALEAEGFNVRTFENPLRGLDAARKESPHLIVADLKMPELDGLELIKRTKAMNPEINVLVITGHGSLETAIGAIRLGASDYLLKPFKIKELLNAVKKALSQKRLISETNAFLDAYCERYDIKNLIGTTPEIKEVFRLIGKVAKTESSVLIAGESGTGKEMVARSIHYHSRRRKGPFVSINCAALPETLLESELFGYEKGAFTGAGTVKMGLLELASNGTFFLDEVGEMSLILQVKLLRALQERVVKRLGGIKDIAVDFRLIAATSKNLTEEIKKGRFREDLFYRLNVIPIILPPLRNRQEDIPVFIAHYLDFFLKKHGITKRYRVTEEAFSVFEHYEWPGNIRELENVIERLITLAESETIDAGTAGHAIHTGSFSSLSARPITSQSDLKDSLGTFERELIEKAMSEARGNQNQAAKKLNLTRQALHYKIKKYGIGPTSRT